MGDTLGSSGNSSGVSGGEFSWQFEVQETDLDVFGHVNNAAYLRLFEQARWQILAENGLNLNDIRKMGIGPVILEVKLQFKKELTARQKISVITQTAGFKRVTGLMTQVMYRSSSQAEFEEVCRAEFVYGLFDLKQRKLVEPNELWMKALGLL